MAKEVFFKPDEVIVSKTNLKGHITYANPIFLNIAGYTEEEILNKPHSIIRHPEMPRCIFKFLWAMLQSGDEIFAYVINKCKNGDYYWVLAHATPSLSESGEITGYHSNRRVPSPEVVHSIIKPFYQKLLEIEGSYANKKEGLQASYAYLVDYFKGQDMTYHEFIFSTLES